MTKKQLALLALTFLIGLCLSKFAAAQSQIIGPEQAQAGTLVTFEIMPPQVADWTITSVETTEKVFQTDTQAERLYFATPRQGTYHIVAAIVVDGKPQVLAKTLSNGSDSDHDNRIKPLPPVPPTPDTPIAQWITTQLPVLVKSPNLRHETQLVSQCFEQTVQKIEAGTIKTAQNARTQLQIALTMSLALASQTAIEGWQLFLTELSKKMADELGDNVNDINAVKEVFQTVLQGLNDESQTILLQQNSSSGRLQIIQQSRNRSLFQRLRQTN